VWTNSWRARAHAEPPRPPKTLNSTEDAHLKTRSTFTSDELFWLRDPVHHPTNVPTDRGTMAAYN